MNRTHAALVLLLAACGGPKPAPGTARSALAIGGETRTYAFHPARSAPKPVPLVIVLHGRLGTGAHAESDTHFTAVAEREGFAVLYPDGYGRSWHDRRGVGPAAERHVDDVAFISALIDLMVREHDVDPGRVYVTGASNGGFMAVRLACELSDKIAAVAPVMAALPEVGSAECRPSHPMPVAVFEGTEDPLVPYAGGDVAQDRGRVLSADATRARFAELAGCRPADVTRTVDRVPDDGTSVTETFHTTCAGDAEVRLYTITGGGHTWPNGTQYLPKAIIGRVTREIDGAEEIWQFFKGHQIPVKVSPASR